MKRYFKAFGYLLSVHVLALLVMTLFRLVEFIALHGMIVDAEASRVMAFVKGVWFDNVIACYISVLPVAVLLIAASLGWCHRRLLRGINIWYAAWSAKRELSKINYHIHTDAIKQNLIPSELTNQQANIIYANEADVLNMALFGITAAQWRETNPNKKGNIRDYATINQLICLSNMENLNAVFIEQGIPQKERLIKLNQIAIQQMKILEANNERTFLK